MYVFTDRMPQRMINGYMPGGPEERLSQVWDLT
jgi:hypothetical protein